MLLLAVRPALEPLTGCCNPSLSFDQQRALLPVFMHFSPQMNDSKKIKPGAREHVWNVYFVWLYSLLCCCFQLCVSLRFVCDEITVSIRQRQAELQRRVCFGPTCWEGYQDCLLTDSTDWKTFSAAVQHPHTHLNNTLTITKQYKNSYLCVWKVLSLKGAVWMMSAESLGWNLLKLKLYTEP